jgi:hypothetical protein
MHAPSCFRKLFAILVLFPKVKVPSEAMKYYDAGGKGSSSTGGTGGLGSVMGVTIGATTPGFLRRVTKPTTIGMAMKITLKHKNTIPIEVAAAGSLLPNTSISAPGIKLANTDVPPRHRPTSPGQPHKSAVAIVAIKPVVLLSILYSPLYKKCDDLSPV